LGAHLRLQGKTWYARLRVPSDVRASFDGKSELYVKLGTFDKATAKLRAVPILARHRAKVLEARGAVGAVENDALWWRTQLRQDDTGILSEEFTREAAKRFLSPALQRALARNALPGEHPLDIIEEHGGPGASRFIGVATGRTTPTSSFIDDWYTAYSAGVEAKTAAMARQEVERFAVEFPTLETVTRPAVEEALRKRAAEGAKPATLRRTLSHLRSYWDFLKRRHEVSETSRPFHDVKIVERSKQAGKGSYLPFEPREVSRLYSTALKQGDKQLADLIRLAAYTGARIEELCALPVARCSASRIEIADAKTPAGNRKVPVHKNIKGLVASLKDASEDGYLLSGLVPNKYGDRSAAIGKRFGRLKSSLGFASRQHVFHSIRHTVVTQMEQGGISENVAAEVVGHVRPRITFGTYSGGAAEAQHRAAVAILKYPGSLGGAA
jgi:integrase